MRHALTALAVAIALSGVLTPAQSTAARRPIPAPSTSDPRDWPVYGGNAAGTRYSTLTQINRDNVGRLQVAWQFDPADASAGGAGSGGLQVNPLVIAGTIYTVTPGGNLVALDGATGTVRWSFKSNSRGQQCRGVTYWTDGGEPRILAAFGRYVYAIDARTGRQVEPFGRGGRIDLHLDLGRDPEANTVDLTSPGVIYKDKYIVGGRTSESLPTFPGDVRAYDARTGQLAWSFHTIPHPGEYGYDTWPRDAWTYIGSANNWAGMAVDTPRGIVYVPTGSPASDFYGGNRLGNGLFGNTLLALDAETGKRIWHFQAVRHDIWDRDLDSPPTLITVSRNGQTIDAVAQATKHGYLFVFNRETGEPLFPIEERPVPASTVPGEVTAATQPFPLKPAPFARTLLTEDMISNRAPAIHQWALEQFKTFRSEGQFVPFAIGQETVIMPGFDGGAEWGGSAFDPETGNLFINANDLAWTSSMRENVPARTVARRTYVNQCAACHGLDLAGAPGFPSLQGIRSRRTPQQISDVIRHGSARMQPVALSPAIHDALVQYLLSGETKGTLSGAPSPAEVPYNFTGYHKWYDPDGYPAVAPPWGTLNAINMNTGDYTWKIPLGEYPELAAGGMKDTGTENYGGPIVTAGGLVFIGATNYDNKFRAFDKDTGTLLWQTTMVNAGNATPATYEVNGRQYVIMPAFGGKAARRGAAGASTGGAFVAFALPVATGAPAIGAFTGSGDIGTPSTIGPGSAVHDADRNSYTVSGGGENMWAAADHLHYVWKKVSGDVMLEATVAFSGTRPATGTPNAHRKACLVIRQTLDSDAVYADAALHGDGLTSLQWRDTKGGVTHEVQSDVVGPARLRIEKRGRYVSLSIAAAGEALHPAGGSARVEFAGDFYIGLGVSAHDTTRIEQASFSNVEVGTPPAGAGPTTLVNTLETINLRSNDRRVAYVVTQPGRIEAPNWFPDATNTLFFNNGGKLYKVQAEPPGTPPNPNRLREPQAVDLGILTRLNNDHGITRDGRMWAISDQSQTVNGTRPSRIYTVPAGGGAATLVTAQGPSYFHGWSPDGRTLAYCAERNGNFDVYTIGVDGGVETRLTTAAGKDDGPEYSPDGQYIYFNSERTGSMQIWRMKADGSQQEQITNEEAENWFPHIAPNGESMVFLTYEKGAGDHPENKDVSLRVMNLATRNVTVLATLFGGQGTINVASWSPNSQYLAFVSYQIVPQGQPR